MDSELIMGSEEQVGGPEQVGEAEGDLVDQDFTPQQEDLVDTGVSVQPNAYQPPPGFKLVPEHYVGVEPTMYAMMLKALGQHQTVAAPSEIRVQMPEAPKAEPERVFHIRLLQQLAIGDIGYNFQRGEEFEYCPAKKFIRVGGEEYKTLRSFLNMWNAHFGPRPDPNVRKKPFFQILNPHDCPPLSESLGKQVPQGRFRSDNERIQYEDRMGDAAYRRVHVHGETGEYGLNITATNPVDPRDVDRNPDETMHPYRRPGAQVQAPVDPYQQDSRQYREQVRQQAYGGMVQQPVDPQVEMQMMLQSRTPVMPPRSGIVGPDGLTPRARMIKSMSGDQVSRPVMRQQVAPPIGGYEPQESVETFRVEQGQLGGGRVISQIPGAPADEALSQAQMLDVEAQRLQSHRTNY